MKELFLQVLTFAYGATGVIGLIGYLPTIKDLYLHKKQSANTSSYILWSSTSGIGFLYGIFILQDTLFRIVYGINFFSCVIVLALSLGLKSRESKDNINYGL